MFTLKQDYEISKKRYDAFWNRELIDRPPVSIILPKEKKKQVSSKSYNNHEEKWLDIEYRAEVIATELENQVYYADALPVAFPNMGPEIFSAWCGCPYIFGENTTWTEPCIKDWKRDAVNAVLDENHPLYTKTIEFMKLLIELGKDNFIVGLPDFHTGGDHIAALRDPQELALDLYENTEEVKRQLEICNTEFMKVYLKFYQLVKAAGMPASTWLPLIHDGTYYVPSNDFSCMISPQMFREFFLPGIIQECHFYEKSIYHLDGPGAVKHLNTLLEIDELDAIQWVPAPNNGGYKDSVEIFQRCQQKNKAIQVNIKLEELPLVFETLKPEGVWFAGIYGIESKDIADEVLRRIAKWA